jgi:Endonuclease/Exonuclease/phosphatase family
MIIASWNVNSIRARVEQVTAWLKAHNPDVLLMQELKGTEVPADLFKSLGYESATVTQKTYNGVAVLSRHPLQIISTMLIGDEADSHARFLEVMVKDIRIANIYLPNGNPVGSEKFVYKLAWMDRWAGNWRCGSKAMRPPWSVATSMSSRKTSTATSRHRGSTMRCFNLSLGSGIGLISVLGTLMLSAPCILGKVVSSHSGIISGKRLSITAEFASITSCYRRSFPHDSRTAK